MSTEKAKRSSAGTAVVVEIGTDWLKAMQVERGAGGLTLVSTELEKLDPIRGISPERLGQILRKFGPGPVLGCLPRQLATVRMVDLPSTNPVEIADMVDLQAGKLTPYSKEEIVTDYKIVGPARDGYTKVMLVIVQRSVLRNRFSLLEEAGVTLSTMSVGTEGILNWMRKAFPAGGGDGAVAVLDVDSAFTELVVIAEDRLLFTRSILVGAAALQSDEAGARDRLAREVGQALQGFAGENAGVRLDRLLLTGAGLNVDGLQAVLAERVDVPVDSADSLQIFRKTPSRRPTQDAPYDTLSLTPLIGMAIDPNRLDFRLVPDSVKLRKDLVQKARALALLGGLVVAAMVTMSLWGTLRFFFKAHHLANLKAEIAAQADIVRAIDQKMKIVDVVTKRGNVRAAMVSVLTELHKNLPPPSQIALDGLEFDTERQSLQFSGTGGSSADIRDLVTRLQESPLFTDVREDATTREGERYRFRLICRLEVPDAG